MEILRAVHAEAIKRARGRRDRPAKNTRPLPRLTDERCAAASVDRCFPARPRLVLLSAPRRESCLLRPDQLRADRKSPCRRCCHVLLIRGLRAPVAAPPATARQNAKASRGRRAHSRRRRFVAALRRDRAVEPAAFQERLDPGIAPGEIVKELHRVLAAAAREEGIAKMIAILALQAAVLLDPFHGVGIEDFRPDVAVVTGADSRRRRRARNKSCDNAAGPARNRRPLFSAPSASKASTSFGTLVGLELVPGLVEQGRAQDIRSS